MVTRAVTAAVAVAAAVFAATNNSLGLTTTGIIIAFSLGAYVLSLLLIPRTKALFVKAGLSGRDLNKAEPITIAESLGAISVVVYFVTVVVFLPVHFHWHLLHTDEEHFPFRKFVEFISALLSICCMSFLGLGDDVLDLAWRFKLILPTIASLPLLMVYNITSGSSTVLMPVFLRDYVGQSLDLGFLFYLYMGMLAVFCTNSINILAGVNGVESGQSLVIAFSILVFNVIELTTNPFVNRHEHELSIILILPFAAVTAALLYHNWFPASVFVGDTFCYFAGMTFAVVGILGHFSKTLLLFFIPQIFNFLYSVPQLFKFVPCPRHRLPKLNVKTGKLENSYFTVNPKTLSFLGRLTIWVVRTFRLAKVHERGEELEISNFTIINFVLHVVGPLHEARLATSILVIQVLATGVAFFVRYSLACWLYADHTCLAAAAATPGGTLSS